ncbi:MAG: V4R domain-containing protein [Nanobdellota archaeon]
MDLSNVNLGMLGDVNQRATLGNETSLVTYRLVRLIAMNLLEQQGGETTTGEADNQVYETGTMLGALIYRGLIKSADNLEDFATKVSNLLKDLKIGILTMEEADTEGELYLRLRVDECCSCSGTPNAGKPICHMEGGLISGLVGEFLHQGVQTKEIKCWGLGDKTCVFEVTPAK